MAKLLIKNINHSSKKYSDGKKVEDKLIKYAKNNKEISNNDSWPIIYNFSKHRENILNWYPFKKNCSILEIGGGCGALTNLLSRKSFYVDSVELEISRARINYERNKNINNINIIVDNINNLREKKYDYVVVIGVLEYAAKFYSNSDTAFIEFIKKCKRFLKKDGIILLSIENRFGLKYFSGNKEDHLNIPFVGINGYQNSDIKTFTKSELTLICKKAGVKIAKWYYPFPDYKFPYEIFTDQSINRIFPLSCSLPVDYNQKSLFDIDSIHHCLMQENIAEHFSNSFLLELNSKSKENIDYVKISSNRNNKFAIATYIDYKNNIVYKKGLYKETKKHLRDISNSAYYGSLLKNNRYRYNKEIIYCDFIKGECLSYKIYKMSLNNEIVRIKRIVQLIKNDLYQGEIKTIKTTKSFNDTFGKMNFCKKLHWKKDQCIDVVPNNIIIDKNKYYLVDNEWSFRFAIPSEYILWRFLFYFPIESIYSKKELVKDILEIDNNIYDNFYKMELHFVCEYVGTEIEQHYKKRRIINI